MNLNRKLLIALPLFVIPMLMSDLPFSGQVEVKKYEAAARPHVALADTLLPIGYNYLFAGSGVCENCHGYDTARVASVDAFQNDVNVVSDWRATMMANSAKDPFWLAKVSHEVLLYPQHQAKIEDKCTTCHAPMGHFDAKHLGASHYSMADLAADPIAKDGVSCLACHSQRPEGSGFSFSGALNYDTAKIVYGQYPGPLVSPMLTETGFKPKFSPHVSEAGICAGCHTLITETLDHGGNLTGDHFVEQATYHEWLNSGYNAGVTCQDCHMPSLEKFPVFLIAGLDTEPRSPFSLHEFVGGNVSMLKLLRNNIATLDLKANEAQFEDVIGKTLDMLQLRTLDLSLELLERNTDTVRFALKLTNLAGHKFPSGYPSRRAFIEFLVKTAEGDTLFHSGKMDGDYEVLGQNADYEPHYQTIRSEDQVQVYELVMGDVNGEVTTVLLRAKQPIKDNRLPPQGFSKNHPTYDTVKIAGEALYDDDFNRENGVEGSGSDRVYFHIPLAGNPEPLFASARVFYQPVPPKWNKEMFAHSTPQIDAFRSLLDATDRKPVLVKEATLSVDPLVGTSNLTRAGNFIRLYPVPTADGRIFVQSSSTHGVQVFDLKGNPVEVFAKKTGNYELLLKGRGVFLLRFEGNDGKVQVERVVVR